MQTPKNYVLTNTSVASMEEGDRYGGLISNGAVVIAGDEIEWVGEENQMSELHASWEQIDLGGALVTPGLIDCHTHIVYGGNRANEFEMRLEGASYEEVARAGGGILSTMNATRAATVEELVETSLPRLDALLAEGVTTLEIKSGYGLNLEAERNMLQAARQLEDIRPIAIKTSFLGAHALPPEFDGDADAYINHVATEMLPSLASDGLIDAVDGFCEGIAFSPAQMRVVFDVAKTLGLPIKLHAEQLSNLGGAKLAAECGALSADHLEYLDEDGVKAMADAGTVAVVLPGAFYTLRETQAPPIDLFRKHNVQMAVATDSNPGSSPMTSLLLAMNMAATFFRLTPEEALRGATLSAAKALGMDNQTGSITAGKQADLAVWRVQHPAELTYRIGFNPIEMSIFRGQIRD